MEVIEFTDTLPDTHLLVDARSPGEYAEDHIPGAINVPLLDDAERAEVGTLYKQQGPLAARRRGLELTAAKFPLIVDDILSRTDGRPLAVYCWRGGLRSRTVVTILDLTGYPAAQVQGGYRSFRNRVVSCFETFSPPAPLVVLHGMTGIGKTTLLARLAERGETVVDLEGLARHRGSAFGEVGQLQDVTQKRFESLLWDTFRRARPGRPIFVEGESRRIGRIFLPGDLYEKMREGVLVWCEASLETRVTRLITDYGRQEYLQELAASLGRIRKKLGGEKHDELAGYLERWEMEPFMRELMTCYYDRLYYRTREWEEAFRLSVEDLDAAARELPSLVAATLARKAAPPP